MLSRLWIGGATSTDTGNYTCTIPGRAASEFPRAKVKVHVVDGEITRLVYRVAKSNLTEFPFELRLILLRHL